MKIDPSVIWIYCREMRKYKSAEKKYTFMQDQARPESTKKGPTKPSLKCMFHFIGIFCFTKFHYELLKTEYILKGSFKTTIFMSFNFLSLIQMICPF